MIGNLFSKQKIKEDLLAYCLRYGNGENGPDYRRIQHVDIDAASQVFLSNCSIPASGINSQSIIDSISRYASFAISWHRKPSLSEDGNAPAPILQSIFLEH